MERNIQVKALVIGSRNFGELHRSVTLLSPELGLINTIIFGGRKGKKSSLAPLFSFGTFQLYHNPVKDEYSLLEEDLEFVSQTISSDLKAVYTASFICEVVNCINSDDNFEVYSLSTQAIKQLEITPDQHRKVLIDFTYRLLLLSGVGSDFESCPSCDRHYKDEETLHFSTSMITPVCEDCSDNHQIVLMPGSRRYLKYTQNMSFEEAFKVELYETAQDRLSSFLLKWITIFCQKPLFTVRSGLL